jgi:hypothetical protein
MEAPFETILPDSDVRVFALSEVKLTHDQVRAIEEFNERTGSRWTVEFVRAGVTPMWLASSRRNVVVDFELGSALRLAVCSEERW